MQGLTGSGTSSNTSSSGVNGGGSITSTSLATGPGPANSSTLLKKMDSIEGGTSGGGINEKQTGILLYF